MQQGMVVEDSVKNRINDFVIIKIVSTVKPENLAGN